MGKNDGSLRPLLDKALKQGAVERIKRGEPAGLTGLGRAGFDVHALSLKERAEAAATYYLRVKAALGRRDFALAVQLATTASELGGNRSLAHTRLPLLREVARRQDPMAKRLAIHEMQRRLQRFSPLCTKDPCRCTSHAEVACCRKMIDDGYPTHETADDIQVHFLGTYHAYTKHGAWTKLVKAVKEDHEVEWLELMADIVADHLFEATDLLTHIDVLVPVPPDPRKFAQRGFAPNDILTKHLGVRLGVPFEMALSRGLGVPTREATLLGLIEQLHLEKDCAPRLTGCSALLVDDVWRTGKSICAAAATLRDAGVREVSAVVLARAAF